MAFNFEDDETNYLTILVDKKSNPSIKDLSSFNKYLEDNNIFLAYEINEEQQYLDNLKDTNISIFNNGKVYVDYNIHSLISFGVSNNISTTSLENSRYISKNKNNIDNIESIKQSQVTMSLNILQLQKDASILNNGEISDYKNYSGYNVSCANTLEGRTGNTVIMGKTLNNILLPSNTYVLSTNFTEDMYTKTEQKNNCTFKLTKNDPSKYCFINLGNINLSLLKPNTKYTVFCEGNTNDLEVGITTASYTNQLSNFSKITNNKAIITTNDLSNGLNNQILYCSIHFNDVIGKEISIRNVVILEGEYDNLDYLNYFEGMSSVGESESNIITIKSIGTNLIDTGEKDIFQNKGTDEFLKTVDLAPIFNK